MYLIVGLRNPGAKYEKTRHNIGEMLLQEFIKPLGVDMKKSTFKGDFGSAIVNGNKVLFLLPSTYMNLSGEAILRCMEYYKIGLSDLLVICDDVEIPFGTIRIRPKGSSGGHNGLKNIQQQLGSSDFARLRLGVGKNQYGDLADYVVAPFTPDEKVQMQDFLVRGTKVLSTWLSEGIEAASQKAGELNKFIEVKGE